MIGVARVTAATLLALMALPTAGAMAAAAKLEPAGADPVKDWRRVIVAAIRNCPQTRADEIVVCAKDVGDAPPAWRYPRLAGDAGARFDPNGDTESVSRARHRIMEGGEAGTGSCGPVGAGGFTGCQLRAWRRNDQQHGE